MKQCKRFTLLFIVQGKLSGIDFIYVFDVKPAPNYYMKFCRNVLLDI